MLNRVLFDVFGTLEYNWAPEKRMFPPGSPQRPDLRIELDFVLRLRRNPRVRTDLAGCDLGARAIPLRIVVMSRAILQWRVPVPRMKSPSIVAIVGGD